ncbi:MAG TPA: hypothetical protein VGM62_02295 [Chthoniobacterales bacterium]|jgi:hypothetical protein
MRSAIKAGGGFVALAAAVWIGTIHAQQPTPQMIVVQPAGTTATATPAPTAASSDSAVTIAIKALEQVKAANDATLKKQEAMLQQLDELQKAAEQLKVFSKRV